MDVLWPMPGPRETTWKPGLTANAGRGEPERVFLIPRLRAKFLLVNWMGIRPAVTVETWER